ncbi:hypothetical protein Trisim1_004315 [Trichoderma cf. simile WF8]
MCQDLDNSDSNPSSQHSSQNFKKSAKTYNSRCSLMVTHLTTNLPVSGLSMGEQTGPRILHYLWSYVLGRGAGSSHIADASELGVRQRSSN